MSTYTVTDDNLVEFFDDTFEHLNERQRRIMAGSMARTLGHGGIKAVAGASGLSLRTVQTGALEVDAGVEPSDQVRKPGAGRKKAEYAQPGLGDALFNLVEPSSRGDPTGPLMWTTKGTHKLADELKQMGFQVSQPTVGKILTGTGFSLQAPSKTREGTEHPDRDAQFRYLNAQASKYLDAGEPVISVDAKNKELIGNYATGGREWQPTGEPTEVNMHDFPDDALGKAVPYGVYDLSANAGWVSVGTSADTAEFAAQTIHQWWKQMGQDAYPKATKLLITADAGGSNGYRNKLWKREIAAFAEETGLEVTVCHFPPGTSKWNKIEHRLFSHITMNWRGRPLESHEVIVNLIANTTTRTGLTVRAKIDRRTYVKGIDVPGREIAALPIVEHEFHGRWNYTIKPSKEANQESK